MAERSICAIRTTAWPQDRTNAVSANPWARAVHHTRSAQYQSNRKEYGIDPIKPSGAAASPGGGFARRCRAVASPGGAVLFRGSIIKSIESIEHIEHFRYRSYRSKAVVKALLHSLFTFASMTTSNGSRTIPMLKPTVGRTVGPFGRTVRPFGRTVQPFGRPNGPV